VWKVFRYYMIKKILKDREYFFRKLVSEIRLRTI
jgi:hypothetical protein